MSIATQRNTENINLKVYLINDCDGSNYEDIIKYFRQYLDITYLVTPQNLGCGGARQYGIDHSNQEWIAFIDSDDVFSSPYSLIYLYDEANKMECDVLVSNYYEERKRGDKLLELERDVTRMHGKLFKRSYLEKYNIRFNEKLRLNEDGNFNTLAIRLSNAVAFFPFYSYVWCDNPKSLTRTGDYLNQYAHMYAYGMVDATEKLIQHNAPSLERYFRSVVANLYYYKINLTNSQFKDKFEESEYDKQVLAFLKMFDVDKIIYQHKDEMMSTLQFMVNKMFGEGYKPQWEPFEKFLKMYI